MQTKTKLKSENRKRLKTKKLKTKMPKQQNLSLNERASIQYGTYGCYGHTALNPWLMVDGIEADHQHVFVSRFDIIWLFMFTGKTKTKTEMKKMMKAKTKLKLKNNWKTKTKNKTKK